MGPIFWLKIIDWKKDKAEVEISKPYIERFFSTDWRKSKIVDNSTKSLNYFDNEADLNVNEIQLRFNDLNEQSPFINYDPFCLFHDYLKGQNFFPNNSIISSRSVITKIMNTPFEINQDKRKWTLKAELVKDKYIYLYYDKHKDDKLAAKLTEKYELLKRHLFVKIPTRYYRKATSVFSEIFGEIIRLKIGSHDLFYTTEIPGVISDHEITKDKEIRAIEHFYCDVFKSGEFPPDQINYNPIWWSKAALINANQCIVGSYDQNDDCINAIFKFDASKFEDKTKYENLWSPDAAWNFLNDFLRFVSESVKSVANENKNKCVWKFQSFEDGKPFVTCETLIRTQEDGKESLSPIMLNVTNFP